MNIQTRKQKRYFLQKKTSPTQRTTQFRFGRIRTLPPRGTLVFGLIKRCSVLGAMENNRLVVVVMVERETHFYFSLPTQSAHRKKWQLHFMHLWRWTAVCVCVQFSYQHANADALYIFTFNMLVFPSHFLRRKHPANGGVVKNGLGGAIVCVWLRCLLSGFHWGGHPPTEKHIRTYVG